MLLKDVFSTAGTKRNLQLVLWKFSFLCSSVFRTYMEQSCMLKLLVDSHIQYEVKVGSINGFSLWLCASFNQYVLYVLGFRSSQLSALLLLLLKSACLMQLPQNSNLETSWLPPHQTWASLLSSWPFHLLIECQWWAWGGTKVVDPGRPRLQTGSLANGEAGGIMCHYNRRT